MTFEMLSLVINRCNSILTFEHAHKQLILLIYITPTLYTRAMFSFFSRRNVYLQSKSETIEQLQSLNRSNVNQMQLERNGVTHQSLNIYLKYTSVMCA